MVGIADNTVDLIENSKETRRTELTACNESLGEFDIRRGIFQGSSVLPLLFVICSYTFIDTLQQDKPWICNKSKSEIDSSHFF